MINFRKYDLFLGHPVKNNCFFHKPVIKRYNTPINSIEYVFALEKKGIKRLRKKGYVDTRDYF